MVKCSVCGQWMDEKKSAHKMHLNGHDRYFCSEGCHAKFQAKPLKYVKRELLRRA